VTALISSLIGGLIVYLIGHPDFTQNPQLNPSQPFFATPWVIINSMEIWTGLVCLVPDPSCLALLWWLFCITKWARQGKLAGFHIATQF